MWPICHLRADSVVWLSHMSSIWPWSGAPKVRLYDTFLGGLRHSPPQMKNQYGLNEEKTFIGKKYSLYWVLVMQHVWLVWILPTKHKFLKRVENLERYVIFSCHYLLILLINSFSFAVLTCHLDLIFKRFYSLDIYPFQFIPHWTLIVCSFVFEWRIFLGIWNDAQIFVLRSVPLFPYSCFWYHWRCDHPFWPALSGDGEDHQ
jgi:hypothetical protein